MVYVIYERTSRISNFFCTLHIKVAYYSNKIEFNSIFNSLILNFTILKKMQRIPKFSAFSLLLKEPS